MSEAPDIDQLARQLAVLEERMNTHQATYETALERLERRLAERDAEAAKRDAEAARRDAQKAEREATARWWQTAVILAGIGIAATFIISYG